MPHWSRQGLVGWLVGWLVDWFGVRTVIVNIMNCQWKYIDSTLVLDVLPFGQVRFDMTDFTYVDPGSHSETVCAQLLEQLTDMKSQKDTPVLHWPTGYMAPRMSCQVENKMLVLTCGYDQGIQGVEIRLPVASQAAQAALSDIIYTVGTIRSMLSSTHDTDDTYD
jgi:hypothetical protein